MWPRSSSNADKGQGLLLFKTGVDNSQRRWDVGELLVSGPPLLCSVTSESQLNSAASEPFPSCCSAETALLLHRFLKNMSTQHTESRTSATPGKPKHPLFNFREKSSPSLALCCSSTCCEANDPKHYREWKGHNSTGARHMFFLASPSARRTPCVLAMAHPLGAGKAAKTNLPKRIGSQ